MDLVDVGRQLEVEAAAAGRADEGAREQVRRHLVEGGGETQHVGVPPGRPGGDDRRPSSGSPVGERAGLVEEHDLAGRERLQGGAALDDDADARGPGQAGHDRDRSGEQQRARGRDDEHRDGPHRGPGHGPGDAGQRERQRDEEHGEAVGRADEGRRRRLGLLDEPDDVRVGRLGRRRRGDDVDRRAGVDDSAADVVTVRALDRHRLPGQGGLVERAGREQPAVDRDDLTGADDEHVAG